MALDTRASLSSLGTPRRYSFVSSTEEVRDRPHTRVEDEAAVERKYSFVKELGHGAFGVVHEVVNRLTGQHLAVKIVNKDKPGSTAIRLLEREVEVLKRVNHPYIIRLEEVYETPKKMFLFMELCEGGELTKVLKRKGHFTEAEAKDIMKSLTEVVVYMHDNDMVHRDLKLENILLSTPSEGGSFSIKVTDFGLVHVKSLPGCDEDMISRCGTLYYMAPEVLNNRHEYTKMCDVWSMGVILYTLLCGQVPFKSDNPVKLEELIVQGEMKFKEPVWIYVGDKAKALLRSMLCVDTTQRYTARRVLDDPWFTGRNSRVLTALDLMRDMNAETIGHSAANLHSEIPVIIQEEPSTDKLTNLTSRPPSKSMVGKRTKSTPTMLPAPSLSAGLKSSSSNFMRPTSPTSKSASGCFTGQGSKQRSVSVSSSPCKSPVKRPSTSIPAHGRRTSPSRTG